MQQLFHKRYFLVLVGLGVILSFFAFLTALRGVGFGVWPQSETPMIAIHICSLLSAVGLMGLGIKTQLISFLYKNPLVLIPFLMGCLSVIMLPFHDLPVRSFLGTVRTGEGVSWWFDLSILSAGAFLLYKIKFWRRIIIASALASFLACAALSISHFMFEHYYAPLFFKDYLAFAILCFMPLGYFALTKKISVPILSFVIFYGVLNAAIFLTDNNAMIGYGIVFPLFFAGLWFASRRAYKAQQFLSIGALAAIPLAGLVFFVGLSNIYSTSGFYTFEDTGLFRTVASRAYLVNIAFEAMIQNPLSFITGHGWGSYVDHIATQQPSEWINFTNLKGDQWDGITFDHFHSHNIFADTLNAVGLVGLVLVILYFLSFPLMTKRHLMKPVILMSAGFFVYGSFWFLMPILMPFLVFATASTSGHRPIRLFNKIQIPQKALIAGFAVIALLQVAAASMIFMTAKQTDEYDPAPITAAQAASDCPIEYNDFGAGGLHFSRLILDRLRYTVDLADIDPNNADKESPDAIPAHVQSLNSYFCQTEHYAQAHRLSARISLAHLMMRGEILLALYGYIDDETRHYYYAGWKDELLQWLQSHPKRTDIAVPYLLYNVTHGQENLSAPVLDFIHHKDPNNPIALWFKGLFLLQSPTTTNRGLDFMKQALDNGIDRFVLVDDNTKMMLLQYQ